MPVIKKLRLGVAEALPGRRTLAAVRTGAGSTPAPWSASVACLEAAETTGAASLTASSVALFSTGSAGFAASPSALSTPETCSATLPPTPMAWSTASTNCAGESPNQERAHARCGEPIQPSFKQIGQCSARTAAYVRTLVSEPATSSLDNAAAGAAGVSVSNAAEPAAAAGAAADAALAGARRAGLLAVAFGGGGASGATVADADMGAIGWLRLFGWPCSLPTRAAISATKAR